MTKNKSITVKSAIWAAYHWVKSNHKDVLTRLGSLDYILLLAYLLVRGPVKNGTRKEFTLGYRNWLDNLDRKFLNSPHDLLLLDPQLKDGDGYLRFSAQIQWMRSVGIVTHDLTSTNVVAPAGLVAEYGRLVAGGGPFPSTITVMMPIEPCFVVDGRPVDLEKARQLEKILPGVVKIQGYKVLGTEISKELADTIITPEVARMVEALLKPNQDS